MDGNRTHPGRLNSAPQTVLKTAFLMCAAVQRRPSEIDLYESESADVRGWPPVFDRMAVSLAVKSWLSRKCHVRLCRFRHLRPRIRTAIARATSYRRKVARFSAVRFERQPYLPSVRVDQNERVLGDFR
jgi:hypothetical protein